MQKGFKLDTNFQTLSTNHVLVIGDGSLFQEGVAALLNRLSEAFIYSVKYLSDHALADEIKTCRPDIVIVTASERVVDAVFATTALVDMSPRIIVLHDYDNTIEVFHQPESSRAGAAYLQTQINDSTSADLLRCISSF
ncbi:MAG: hypothetical protein ABI904_02950 [Chloroflexota bacterium]